MKFNRLCTKIKGLGDLVNFVFISKFFFSLKNKNGGREKLSRYFHYRDYQPFFFSYPDLIGDICNLLHAPYKK